MTCYLQENLEFGIDESFAKAARLSGSKYEADSELTNLGVKKFKRRVLGLFGRTTFKTVDELVAILEDMKIVNSKEEGKDFLGKLTDLSLSYGFSLSYHDGWNSYTKHLSFKLVNNPLDGQVCKVDFYDNDY